MTSSDDIPFVTNRRYRFGVADLRATSRCLQLCRMLARVTLGRWQQALPFAGHPPLVQLTLLHHGILELESTEALTILLNCQAWVKA